MSSSGKKAAGARVAAKSEESSATIPEGGQDPCSSTNGSGSHCASTATGGSTKTRKKPDPKDSSASKATGTGRKSRRQGNDFENKLEEIWLRYRSKRLMTVEKIDPPTAVIRKGAAVIVIHKKSKFLDYMGFWLNNRGIKMEAKSTLEPRLYFGDRGLKDSQVAAFRFWGRCTVTALLWHHKGNLVIVTGRDVLAASDSNQSSLKFSDYEKVPLGEGAEHWKIYEHLLKVFGVPPNQPPIHEPPASMASGESSPQPASSTSSQ